MTQEATGVAQKKVKKQKRGGPGFSAVQSSKGSARGGRLDVIDKKGGETLGGASKMGSGLKSSNKSA